ncbi:signal peptidase I [Candidatus Gracilibacteria bacterium]|nr:signal peptidase I [Candidatus Gracilibacteria bacterium]
MTQGINFERHRNSGEITKKIHPNLRFEIREYIFYFLKVFVLVAIVFTFIRTSVFYPTSVDGISMNPTLNQNDIIYIDLFTSKFSDYKRGDVVIVRPPEIFERTGELYIKRVIGLPGEKVGFDNGQVQIYNDNYPNGIVLNESYITDDIQTFPGTSAQGTSQISNKLDSNEYYLMGDNRPNSVDSRSFGVVKKNLIIGKGFYQNSEKFEDKFIELPKYNINN